jgi:signal transduction histidine kinase
VDIELPHGRNALRIDLAVLEMSAPERNRYRYRIPGYREWTERPADRPLELTNMPDGTWSVEVVGVNADGVPSEPVELLVLRVPLPFWASRWAFVLVGSLVVLVAGGLGFLLYRRRVQRRMEKAEQQVKELRIRARIAQDLHDDVGSGLARITVLARSAEKHARKGTLAVDEVEKVRVLSQELMDDLRDVVWVNDPRGGELSDLLLRIRDHVLDLFAEQGAAVVVDLPTPLPERSLGSTAKRDLYLIAKEAAHNSYKYSGADRVGLVFSMTDDEFRLELIDNGRGLGTVAQGGGGHGLGNMGRRASELGCRLIVDAPSGGGTRIHLVGPVSALDL